MRPAVPMIGLFSLLAAGMLWQGPDQEESPAPIVPPGSVAELRAAVVGEPGPGEAYYWVIARHAIGPAYPAGPVHVPNVPVPGADGYVQLNWTAAPGAQSYDILRTAGPSLPPGGECECAIAVEVAGLALQDHGEPPAPYKLTGVSAAAAAITAPGMLLSTETEVDPELPEDLAMVVDVKAMGATGDGETDDTAAIQRAVDAAPDGATVLFPRGQYRLSRNSRLEWSITLRGRKGLTFAGEGFPEIRATADISEKAYWVFMLYGCDGITFRGLRFNVVLSGEPGYRVNAGIIAAGSDRGAGSTNVTIQRNIMTVTHPKGMDANRALYGIFVATDDDEGNVRLCSKWRVLDNRFVNCEGRIIQTWKTEDVVISGNALLNSGSIFGFVGIRMIGGVRKFEVRNNYIEDSPTSKGGYAMVIGSVFGELPAEDGVVGGNVIVSRGIDTEGIKIYGVNNLVVEGNSISQNNRRPWSGYGIRIDPDPGIPIRAVRLAGNAIFGWNTFQIINFEPKLEDVDISLNFIGLTSANRSAQGTYDTVDKLVLGDNYFETK